MTNLRDAPYFNPYLAASEIDLDYRGFKLSRDPVYSLWEIHSDNELPRELMGKFTVIDLAKGKIDDYLKGKKNGK